VLGFKRTGEYRAPDGSRLKVFMRHEVFSVSRGLTGHQHGRQLPFDETAIGLDHLAFAMPTRPSSATGTGASPARYSCGMVANTSPKQSIRSTRALDHAQ
jgi:glyoxylase I family protein